MKILQIVQKPQRRGAEIFAYQLSQTLRTQQHEVQSIYLYPYHGDGGLPLHSEDRILGGQEDHLYEKFPGIHPRLLQCLITLFYEAEPDIVQLNGARTVKYGAFARLMGWRKGILIYRNIGNPQDWVRNWRLRLFYCKLVMPQLDGVIGVSQTTLDNLQEFYHLTIPMTKIPNGIKINATTFHSRDEVRRQLQTPLNANVLLFVGSLSVEKRVDRLLRVADAVRMHNPNIYVWIIGDGPLRQQLEAQAITLNLAGTVRFLGIQEDVASFMAAADLFILTSDSEGVPAVILEAGAYRLPVIATKVGGIPECILDGKTGFLVEKGDEAGLATTILRVLDDPEQRSTMGERAKSFIQDNFSMDKIATDYLKFYSYIYKKRL